MDGLSGKLRRFEATKKQSHEENKMVVQVNYFVSLKKSSQIIKDVFRYTSEEDHVN